jgi:hypothetical protein
LRIYHDADPLCEVFEREIHARGKGYSSGFEFFDEESNVVEPFSVVLEVLVLGFVDFVVKVGELGEGFDGVKSGL